MTAADLRRGPVADAIRSHRLIAVLRRIEPRAALLALVDELAEAGVRVIEVTLDAPSGTDDLAAVRAHLAVRGDAAYVLGAGTVLRLEQLDAARDAGADFVVAPILDVALVRAALEIRMPVIPGALTPTEIAAAWSAGATFVKVFPASAVGPGFVRELRGPLPAIDLVPTGGVDGSNAAAFLAAGAAAVGIGGAFVRATADERRSLVESLLEPA
ncbi:MAG: bifunctional 4-hydroxy-2-oxoglutarate aldolase/2-dehydro-3-deoxy-phosphogluconate aldolase [Chloroflexota bacterium]|nr:bifunctional 4-hydroxy-2-oxoglutarate aldolase/2-dehydro-3-deoxy-phosphogluconate aldolase [Chloroflexota bacterium]